MNYSDYTIKWATLPWEQRQALALRHSVFCLEQSLFSHSDLDEFDERAQLLVAVGSLAGMHDEVVGTVRIHQTEPGVWQGSRLAVAAPFRGHSALVAGLIRLAVGSARGLGCERFLATVQARNQALFRRLHWHSLGSGLVCDRPHVMMQADLSRYPLHHSPRSGLVVRAATLNIDHDLAPDLLHLRTTPPCRLSRSADAQYS